MPVNTTTPLSRQLHNEHGQAAPIITVVGPGGTGKSMLARRIAQMIARAESGPNVLLVDADLYNRGLTVQLENVKELKCGYLYDAIAGKNPVVNPVEITESLLQTDSKLPLPEEGLIYFLPSIRKASKNPHFLVGKIDTTELKNLLVETMTATANRCNAQCIVIDTVSIPEPCAAVLTSISALMILVGNEDKGGFIDEYPRRLHELDSEVDHVPIQIVYNRINITASEHIITSIQTNFHFIPPLDGLLRIEGIANAETIRDGIDFDSHVVAIITHAFRQTYPHLIPFWCSPLPLEWRKLAKAITKLPHDRISHCFLQRIATGVAIGIPALTSMLLAISVWLALQTSSEAYPILPILGVIIGFCFLAVSLFTIIRVIIDLKACHTVVSHLAKADLNWILRRLKPKPEQVHKLSPERKLKRADQQLISLYREFDTLRDCVQSSDRIAKRRQR
jgi:MinD-like ATPase involved in chromosome partitioning or flagellar assembly